MHMRMDVNSCMLLCAYGCPFMLMRMDIHNHYGVDGVDGVLDVSEIAVHIHYT